MPKNVNAKPAAAVERHGPAGRGPVEASVVTTSPRPAAASAQEAIDQDSPEWESIGETVSVGKPVGGVLPVAFWWRHSFYRITEVLHRRFFAGRKELTVMTEAGVFKLEENNRAWVVAARSLVSSPHDLDAGVRGH